MERRAFLTTSSAVGLTLSLPSTAAASRSAGTTTRQQDAYEPLGQVSVPMAAEAVVGDDGETAYLATTNGFAIVDISDPSAPEVLAERRNLEIDGKRFDEVLDVKVDGDLLVVAGPANPSRGSGPGERFQGFIRYDVSDPAAPEPIGEPYETGFHIHNCYLEDELLYIVVNTPEENPLLIYDVSDGVEEIGRWSLLEHEPGWQDVNFFVRYLHDVFVQDDIAYLPYWDAGTYLLDVSDPTDPTYISHVSDPDVPDLGDRPQNDNYREYQTGLPGNDHYATVDETGDLMAVGREAWATGTGEPDGPGGIDLYDLTDPSEPDHRATIEAPPAVNERYGGKLWTTAHNLEIRDGHLYSAWYQGGVKIHDVSDPAEPDELAWWRDPGNAGFWTARIAQPGEVFIASSTEAIPEAPTDGALYTFPVEAGEQADAPSLTDPDDLEFDVVPPEEAESDAENSSENDGKKNSSENGSDENASGTNASESESIPGFGPVSVGVAGGMATLEWLRRRGGD
ncbi:LVIVD repeat-containing protein [Halopiger djelfimassiliensis]|uniref:LVIVD repeat-containing protein n=1 Tax=Halopiger djelfimassiliensis TaxID=1293047 RepID=UPI0006777138|nr:hypothetical protein [Halopiger djelfimassiliensis]